MMQDPDYEPSKIDVGFQLLERAANGIANALHIPSYLGWALIILVLFWLLYFAILTVESIMRYLRYALLILTTIWVVGFMLALQFYTSAL